MKNAFSDVDVGQANIANQEKRENKIVAKTSGRPRRPNMVKKLIKVDKVLYAQIGKLAASENTTIASIIARALKKELK